MKGDKLKHITLRIGRDQYTGKDVWFEFEGWMVKAGSKQVAGEPVLKHYEILLSGSIARLETDD